MDDSDKDAFTLEDAEDMVEDQIRMDKEAGREPLAYDPQFFYDTVVESLRKTKHTEDTETMTNKAKTYLKNIQGADTEKKLIGIESPSSRT